nr:MAG TPA: TRX family protein [Crassvirales sp.]
MKILKFYSPYCGQCRVVTNEFRKNHPSVPVEDVDITEKTDYVEKYGIKSIPTTILIDGDTIVDTWRGVIKTEVINSRIKEYEASKAKL